MVHIFFFEMGKSFYPEYFYYAAKKFMVTHTSHMYLLYSNYSKHSFFAFYGIVKAWYAS